MKTCLCLRILYKLTWISLQDPPSQIPCSCKHIILRFQLLRESIFSSCMHSVPFKNMYVGLTKRPWSLTEFGRLAKKEYCRYKETVHSPFFPLHICTGNHSAEHTRHPFLEWKFEGGCFSWESGWNWWPCWTAPLFCGCSDSWEVAHLRHCFEATFLFGWVSFRRDRKHSKKIAHKLFLRFHSLKQRSFELCRIQTAGTSNREA